MTAGEAWLGIPERVRLAAFLADKLPGLGFAGADTLTLARLPGGSIQESWRIAGAGEGSRPLVLRADGRTTVPASHGRAQEFALLSAAYQGGMACPQPLLLEPSGTIISRPFFLMTLKAGTADPQAVTGLDDRVGLSLARSLAQQLGVLHKLPPRQPGLDFLPPVASGAEAALALYRSWLDDLQEPQPVLEWALRRLGRTMPDAAPVVLCHRDFRTGNYLVEDGELTTILDWEFAGWSDPREDLGWFCSRSWRFRRPDRPAGGIAQRADFLAAYESATGIRVGAAGLRWWEAAASLRWALIALHQRNRMTVAGERSLDLALTGRRLAECEWELLRLLGAGQSGEADDA